MRKQGAGARIIDLTESNPIRCQFTYPPDLLRIFLDPLNLKYDPNPRGSLEARKAVLNYYHLKGVKLDPTQVFLTASTSEAYHYLFRLLFDSGDHLLVPRPSYPLIGYLSQLNDIDVDFFDLSYESLHWKIDFDSLSGAIHSRTRGILIVHPNNPTGSYADSEDRNRLISMAKKHRLPIIADEVFFDYLYPGGQALPKSFSANARSLTFTLNGLSKVAGLPQMKLAWIVITGPKGEVQRAVDRLEVIADTYLSINTPVQNGLKKIFENRLLIQSQVMHRILSNRRFLIRQLKKIPGCVCFNAEGGWYAVLKLPQIRTDDEWAVRMLQKEGVLVHPGHFYDFTREACLILSLLPPEPLFNAGINRFVDRIEKDLR
ncbi:MAG: pyridoxal phosphate-dependent aminotransferase [Nitrospirae bacterium]|nr:pyridoxal phosphate-dependent aminotransferase [Nitrospirota bacterium]MBI3352277.1 pyridoxal phosphate-dependent aminotransferase [Nitrospirota bacterium]